MSELESLTSNRYSRAAYALIPYLRKIPAKRLEAVEISILKGVNIAILLQKSGMDADKWRNRGCPGQECSKEKNLKCSWPGMLSSAFSINLFLLLIFFTSGEENTLFLYYRYSCGFPEEQPPGRLSKACKKRGPSVGRSYR